MAGLVDKDIHQFTEAIGAVEPQPGQKSYERFRARFKRSNYFFLNGNFLIIKISRSKIPFWGVGKDFIDLLNRMDMHNYFLVLLVSSTEGWVFSKNEVNANISSDRWRLREKDNNYKIHMPLPDRNSFSTPANFLKKVGVDTS